MAENIDVNVNVNTSQANRNLDNLNNRVNGLNQTFSRLKAAVAGIAIGGFVTSTIKSAQAAKDLSEQTGLAVQSVLGLREAFRANASSAEAADSAMVRLTRNISEARNGNDELAKSFEELGVNVYDSTQTIDEQIIKTIEGLGKITNQADQTRLSMELAGKTGIGAYAGIAAGLRSTIAGQSEAAQAAIRADAAAEKFEEALATLQRELLIVLEPLSKFVSELNLSAKAVKDFVQTAASIALVIASVTFLGRASRFLIGVFNTLKNAGSGLIKTFQVIGHYLGRLLGLIDVKNPKNTILGGLAKSAQYAAKEIAALVGVLGTVASFIIPDTVLSGFRKLGQVIGVVKTDAEVLAEMNKRSAEEHSKSNKKDLEEKERIAQKTKEQIDNIREIAKAYKDAGQELLKNVDNEIKYIGMTDRAAEVERAVDDVRRNQVETVKKLKQELEKLPAGEKERRAAIIETIAAINADTEATVSGLRIKLPLLQQERDLIEARNRAIEFGETVRRDNQTLDDLRAEIEMLGMSRTEREEFLRLYNNEKALKERLAAIDAEAARIGKNATQDQIDGWKQQRDQAIDFYKTLGDLQEQREIKENKYTTVVKNAIDEIGQQYEKTRMIQDAISMSWNRIGNAIDKFVETGKLSFKDLAKSIIQDLTAMIAKALVFQALQSAIGAIFPGVKLPSVGMLASGGPAMKNTPYVVGERGPELFVPNQSGMVVPNNKLNGGGNVTNNYITNNNISALDAKSVAQLFAENRKSLLGSVQMAQKELPYSMG